MNVIKNFITTQAFAWIAKEKEDGNSLAGFIVNHIEQENKLRDAQKNALIVYLWLKCEMNNQTIDELLTRNYPDTEGSSLKTLLLHIANELQSDSLKKFTKQAQYEQLKQFFLDFIDSYDGIATLLFSLPMGAGKTFVMASMIYIDLYFNLTTDDERFAKNFLIFAPSGLKSSVIPSLRTIEHFDPTWVLPDDIARQITKQLKFVVLDVNKTAKKSNRIENPNARKVQSCLNELQPSGYIFVTNAEKVILDKIVEDPYKGMIFGLKDDEKSKQANELRHLLGKVPKLTIFMDEVHHNQKEENKLRLVINNHFTKNTTSIIGFTGTPYFKRKLTTQSITLTLDQIPNTVYHYELKNGVRNFLKQPLIKSFSSDTETIVNASLEDFYTRYYHTTYANGRKPKLAIYCATIEKLEEQVMPLVLAFCQKKGLDNTEILRYYGATNKAKSGKKHVLEKDAEIEFNKLDTPYSTKRIVLLCQIGKEGWDCQSLSGVVLSGEGDSPKNMVLQTACRCLREVDDVRNEIGLIYLNNDNYKHLERELLDAHKISIKDFEEGIKEEPLLQRYDRRKHLKLPPIAYNQFLVQYQCTTEQKTVQTQELLNKLLAQLKRKIQPYFKPQITTTRTDFDLRDASSDTITSLSFYAKDYTFVTFENDILKSSFGTVSTQHLVHHQQRIREIYQAITHFEKFIDGFDRQRILSAIHASFIPQLSLDVQEKIDNKTVAWIVGNLNKNPLNETAKIYPENIDFINKISEYDAQKVDPNTLSVAEDAKIHQLEETKNIISGDQLLVNTLNIKIESMKRSKLPIKYKDKSFHYIPYDFTSSNFEREILEKIFQLQSFQDQSLEIYFNGDRFISEFKIKIYKRTDDRWKLIQNKYTPDFLIIKRNKKNAIIKTLIIETKGRHLAHNFEDIKAFMQNKFTEINPKKFDFLYLEDGKGFDYQVQQIHDRIQEYFQ
jgi:hypothetical protein